MTKHSENRKDRGYLNYRPIRYTLTDQEIEAIRALVSIGTRIACLPLNKWPSQPSREFQKDVLKRARCSMSVLDERNATDAIAAVTGETFDVIDIDPRNGGNDTWSATRDAASQPFASVLTPGSGQHLYVAPTGLATKHIGGIDYLAHRSWVYLPGTLRPKYNGTGYQWLQVPDPALRGNPDSAFLTALAKYGNQDVIYEAKLTDAIRYSPCRTDTEQPFLGKHGLFTHLSTLVANAPPGQRNNMLNWAARKVGKAIGTAPNLLRTAETFFMHACEDNNLIHDDGESACRTTIRSGFTAAHNKKED